MSKLNDIVKAIVMLLNGEAPACDVGAEEQMFTAQPSGVCRRSAGLLCTSSSNLCLSVLDQFVLQLLTLLYLPSPRSDILPDRHRMHYDPCAYSHGVLLLALPRLPAGDVQMDNRGVGVDLHLHDCRVLWDVQANSARGDMLWPKGSHSVPVLSLWAARVCSHCLMGNYQHDRQFGLYPLSQRAVNE